MQAMIAVFFPSKYYTTTNIIHTSYSQKHGESAEVFTHNKINNLDDFIASSTSVTDYALMIVDHNAGSRLREKIILLQCLSIWKH